MIYRIRHTTTYDYSDPVSLCHNLAHLTPRDGGRQSCVASELKIEPAPAVSSIWTDYFGNPTTFFTIQEPHEQLIVTAIHTAEVTPPQCPDPATTLPWNQVRDALPNDRTPGGLNAYQFAFDSPYVRAHKDLREYAAASFPDGRPILEGVLDLTKRIHADFRYDQRATTVSTPLAQVFAQKRGVCQDFAHLEIGCLRSLGLAARYVSGYLSTTTTAGQRRLVGADASHAWLAVYCPPAGWIEVDPTNNQVPGDKHIHLAWGRDFDDVSPIKGVILGGGQHTVSVAVEVVPDGQVEGKK
jgi:transglutaminase-like putative cysteine protease